MLREFNRLAREMLFLQGHLTRPSDWAESAAAGTTTGGPPVDKGAAKRAPAGRFATPAAACGIVTPLGVVVGQLR